MVTSAAVPDVVANATSGKHLFLVLAAPSSDLTSANSGLVAMTAIAFAVSMTEPPPTATITSGAYALNFASPACTFAMVGFAFTSSNSVYATPAPSRTSVTFFATPNLTRSLSDTTNAFFMPRRASSPASSARQPAPK